MTETPSPYVPLARPADGREALTAFLTERLHPELSEIRDRLKRVSHRADLLEIGQRAIALRMELSEWQARGQRTLDRAWLDQYQAVWEASLTEAKERDLRAIPADLLKARAKERVGDLQEAMTLLSNFRSDLDSLQSLVQTGIRSMLNEELGQLDGGPSFTESAEGRARR